MADTKIINIKVDHNLEATTKSTNQLTSSLKGAANATTELGGKSDGLGKLQGGIDAVGNAVSGLNPAFGAAIKSSNGLILKMWEMVANPIGAILAAIVVTLKFLYESFQSSVAGGKELKAVFAAVSAVGAQVKDAIFGLGRALIDVATAAYKFITLDFKGAAESMKKANQEATNSYKQLGNAVDGTTAKIIYNLEKQQQANDKARKIQAVVQSETNKLLVQSREILTDETASINEKKKALEEVTKAEKASSKEKTRIAAEDLRILKDRAAAMGGEAEKKMKGEIRDATIALNEAETENAMTGIKLNKQKKMLLRQETSDQKEAIDAQKAKDKELSDAKKKELEDRAKNISDHKKAVEDLEKKYNDDLQNLNAKTDEEKLDLQAQRDLSEIQKIAKTANEKANLMALYNEKYVTLNQELDDKQKVAAEKTAADKKSKDEKEAADKLKLAKETADAELKIQELKHQGQVVLMQKSAEVLGMFSDMLGKQTAAGKTLAIAQATINAYVGISEVWKAKNIYPEPFGTGIKIASTVAMAASAFKTVRDITAVRVPGGGGGGSAPSAPSGSAPAAPSFNVVGNSGVNQIAGVMQQQGAPVVKTYVTAGDVTTAQGLNRNIVSNATLG